MKTKKLIVLTLDALAPSALGCYGSSWNSTPAIDALAATGCVWDRMITSNTQPLSTLDGWLRNAEWISTWKSQGTLELLSDSQNAISLATKSDLDQLYLIDPVGETDVVAPADEIESTQFAQLIAAAAERINEDSQWSVLWLHSDFLQKCWDAPRWLIEPEPADEWDDEPLDEAESLEAEMLQNDQDLEESLDALPYVFESVQPPCFRLAADAHPDLIAAWMRTYACQIRLIDELINVLQAAVGDTDATIALAGTSGISLGQNGWIGHQAGTLRSCHVRVPVVISDHGPLRMPALNDAATFAGLLTKLGAANEPLVDAQEWSQNNDDAFAPSVISQMGDDMRSLTTPQWFFVDEGDEDYRLYLKPDDINDFNDVSRLRPDVVKQLQLLSETNGA